LQKSGYTALDNRPFFLHVSKKYRGYLIATTAFPKHASIILHLSVDTQQDGGQKKDVVPGGCPLNRFFRKFEPVISTLHI